MIEIGSVTARVYVLFCPAAPRGGNRHSPRLLSGSPAVGPCVAPRERVPPEAAWRRFNPTEERAASLSGWGYAAAVLDPPRGLWDPQWYRCGVSTCIG
jgi:hypothetical protein